jgi:ATP-dependent DNA helicase RecG
VFLREITQKIQYLKGIGPRLAARFEKLGIVTVADLLLHVPRTYQDRGEITPLSRTPGRERANVIATVAAYDYVGFGRKRTLKVFIKDASGVASLVCFGRNFLEKVFIIGRRFFISGAFAYRFGEIQCAAFDYLPAEEFEKKKNKIFPFYPLTEGLFQKTLQSAVERALQEYGPKIDDELPLSLRDKYGFSPKREAVAAIHFPQDQADLDRARAALTYEELFYLELIITRAAFVRRTKRAARRPAAFVLKRRLLDRLPFRLTSDQERAVAEIENDLFSAFPLYRLLQGDVGSGKTLVALIAALDVIEAGEQAVFMAPTELLARQHAGTAAALVEPLGVRTALLTGGLEPGARDRLLAALRAGEIDLLIGTHALFSADVTYRRLGLAIIDEQHRFGVLQRKALAEKGAAPDLLLMTATPIPRTLALTAFGDLDSSLIKNKPPGRLKIITHLAREGNEAKVYERVRAELAAGRQAYFVYPLIEESEKIDLKNAIGMYEDLSRAVFPDFRLGLIHSRLSEEEKRTTMEKFISGELDVLVATSVVEVGVDVPNATVLVVEHAERFGLSALHQLRGRVGRSERQSYAFLVYGRALTPDAVRRLKIMLATDDGFAIAEEDLKIRGPGALLGVMQSGFLRLTFADLSRDAAVLLKAKADAQALLAADPGLLADGHRVVREVLERVPPFPADLLDTG